MIFALLSALPETLDGTLDATTAERSETHDFIRKLPVFHNKKITLLELDRVIHVQADGHYTAIFTAEGQYLCNLAMSEVETKLDPHVFVRVHRSHIVNIHHAKSFERLPDQAMIAVDDQGESRIPVSRDRVPMLHEMLGL